MNAAAQIGAGLRFVGCFYERFIRMKSVDLVPGVRAVLDGGCNSLVVEDGGEALLIDPKFPPMSAWLARRLRAAGARVTRIVDTHYHFDHARGNIHYPGAEIVAHEQAPPLMDRREGAWWSRHPGARPTTLVGDRRVITLGDQEILLQHPGSAHTAGDLWAYLRRGGVEIVVAGDLFFHGYYPFFDLEGGADVGGIIAALRRLAAAYPDAVFLPGHGPLARAADATRYADYLTFLRDAVADARARGLGEDAAARSVDLSGWGMSALPVLHYGEILTTAESNIRSMYRMLPR